MPGMPVDFEQHNKAWNSPGMIEAAEMETLQTQEAEMSGDQVEFAVFCIENVASKLGLSGAEAYQLLTGEQNILDEYIIPHCEILHTQGKEYIVNDILDYMQECGVLK